MGSREDHFNQQGDSPTLSDSPLSRSTSLEEFLVLERYFDLEEKFSNSALTDVNSSNDYSTEDKNSSESLEEFLKMDKMFGTEVRNVLGNSESSPETPRQKSKIPLRQKPQQYQSQMQPKSKGKKNTSKIQDKPFKPRYDTCCFHSSNKSNLSVFMQQMAAAAREGS